jgi:hypothetical protein
MPSRGKRSNLSLGLKRWTAYRYDTTTDGFAVRQEGRTNASFNPFVQFCPIGCGVAILLAQVAILEPAGQRHSERLAAVPVLELCLVRRQMALVSTKYSSIWISVARIYLADLSKAGTLLASAENSA